MSLDVSPFRGHALCNKIKDYFYLSHALSPKKKWIEIAISVAIVAIIILCYLLLPPVVGLIIIMPCSFHLGRTIVILLCDYGRNFCRKFKERHDGTNVNNQDVILYISSKYDSNGAITMLSTGLRKLMFQKKYQIVFKEASSLDDIQQVIENLKKQNNHIHSLWISAHGNPESIYLQETGNYNADVSNGRILENFPARAHTIAQKKIKRCFSQLDKDSTIVLASCSTGKVDADGKINIAQTIATYAPGHRVIAPI